MRHFAALLIASLLSPSLASAQEEAPPETGAVRQARETARPLARRGFEAFEREAYDEALKYFREAEGIFHAPIHNLFIARSLRAQDRKLEAHAVYRQVVDEKLASYAPVPFLEAQGEARTEMKALEAELGAIEIQTDAGASVTVDGDATDPNDAIFVLPGEHEVSATVPWVDPPQSRALTLEAGSRETVTFEFPPRPAPPSAEPERPFFTPAVVSLSLGGVALVVGTATGVVHLEDVSDIRSRCLDDRCPPEEEGPAGDTTTVGHVSTAMFVIGGLAAAVGATLLILDLTGDEAPVADARLGFGPAGWTLTGRF